MGSLLNYIDHRRARRTPTQNIDIQIVTLCKKNAERRGEYC